jgi:glutathione peroxidase
MSIYDVPVKTLQGEETSLKEHANDAMLIVNVASKCGLTPQYEGLEKIHEQYKDRGFTVVGVPCNQFMGQEPGTAEEIAEFCSATYGVTFPMTEKVEVNGEGAHPLYRELTATPDAQGDAGDVKWNFEKFLLSADGRVVARFRPQMEPDAPEVVAAIEAAVPEAAGLVTFEDRPLPFPPEFSSETLEAELGPISWTPLDQGVRETIELYRDRAGLTPA